METTHRGAHDTRCALACQNTSLHLDFTLKRLRWVVSCSKHHTSVCYRLRDVITKIMWFMWLMAIATWSGRAHKEQCLGFMNTLHFMHSCDICRERASSHLALHTWTRKRTNSWCDQSAVEIRVWIAHVWTQNNRVSCCAQNGSENAIVCFLFILLIFCFESSAPQTMRIILLLRKKTEKQERKAASR